jgi:succinoglycan biosynthesis protein ExoH
VSERHLIFERIAILRYLMIVGIVMLHMPPYVPIQEIGPGAFEFIKAFFQNAVFRTTVPVLTAISGYLLFRERLDQQWMKLLKKKLRSIVFPFLVFNLTLLAGAFVAQAMLGYSISYQLSSFDMRIWFDAAFGITQSPINYPLNFLRDLFVLILLAPLFGIVLRSAPWLGLILISVIFVNNLDGLLILRGPMPVMFYLGGMVALRNWNLFALDRYALPCLAVFLGLCSAIVILRVPNTVYLRIVAPFLLWPSVSLLQGTRVGCWLQVQSKYSFFIFLAHAPLVLLLSMAYNKVGQGVPYPLYWCITPIIVVTILTKIYCTGMLVCPVYFAPMIGLKQPSATLVHPVSMPVARS